MFRLMIAILCAATTSLATNAETLREGFIRKPLAQIMKGTPAAGEELETFPVYFTIPDNFVTFYGGARVGVLLATQQDINAMTKSGSIQDAKSGFFRVTGASPGEYDSRTGKFSDESDPQLKEKLAAAGLKNCSFRRVDANGIPMLASTCMKTDRRSFMLHIANVRPSEIALKVFYFHPLPYSARDEEVWSQFIGGLPGAN